MRRLISLFVLVLLAGCAIPAEERHRQVRSFLEARQDKVVVQQWDISCGAAALATILTYQHGDHVTEKEVAAGMLRRTSAELVRQRLGFSLLDLKRYAQSRGFVADGYSGLTVEDLLKFGPTIVPIEARGGLSHFVVFRGTQGDRVLIADPGFGNRTMTIEKFERIWQRNIGFTVARSDGSRAVNLLAAKPGDFWASSVARRTENIQLAALPPDYVHSEELPAQPVTEASATPAPAAPPPTATASATPAPAAPEPAATASAARAPATPAPATPAPVATASAISAPEPAATASAAPAPAATAYATPAPGTPAPAAPRPAAPPPAAPTQLAALPVSSDASLQAMTGGAAAVSRPRFPAAMLAASDAAPSAGDVIVDRGDDKKRAPSRKIAAVEPAHATPERTRADTGAVSPITEAMSRGEALLAVGDLVSARALFKYAANLGSSAAARLVARTYDPDYFEGVVGLKPDPNLAADWYRRAAEMKTAGVR